MTLLYQQSNKPLQLQQLHNKILQLNNQYMMRNEQWLRIKYTLTQLMMMQNTNSNNKELSAQSSIRTTRRQQNNKMMMMNDDYYQHYQHLREVIKLYQREHEQVNKMYQQLFGEYQQQLYDGVDSFNASLAQTNQHITNRNVKKLQKTTVLLDNNNTNNNKDDDDLIKLQIKRQQHKNIMIQKQLAMLSKQFNYLQGYLDVVDVVEDNNKKNNKEKEKDSDMDDKQGQQLIMNSNIHDNYGYDIDHHKQQLAQQLNEQNINNNNNNHKDINKNNNNNNHKDINKNNNNNNHKDQQLQSQISCLNKLIKNKLLLVNQLDQQNQSINNKVRQLHARQAVLKKKKLLLQQRERTLNQNITNLYNKPLMEQNTQSTTIIIGNGNMMLHQKQQANLKIKQSSQQIHQLITSTLDRTIKQQQLIQIKQKFNLTI